MSIDLKIPGTFNFRDFSEVNGTDGPSLKPLQLVRGGFLSDVTDLGLATLAEYGIKTVIDLRSPNEMATFPDRLSPQMRYLKIPVFDDDPTSSTMSDKEIKRLYADDDQFGYNRMLRSYRKMVIDPHAIAAYQDFFEAIITYAEDGGILFHCSAGKDRTGFCSYLLLAVLGVSEQANMDFYLASNAASTDRIKWRLDQAKKDHLGSCFIQSVHDLVVVRRAYIEQAVSLINDQFGGIDAYVRDVVGLTESLIDSLKQVLIK
ncbi:tyrosine-protein phosphatase [Secundilactobacillus kimchicus]|uniref:Protein tyrosine serine phosphatase n=1 Tax=Secundilactobacillus kimchicus JCM 15530 TaxID=1302272 RepID=A0A0R1HL69_9LACO|nr:tyrosine-protein phosphatase [Secundilactobacillus kimchicus]KRK47254.1 protein tyrosine serine phosphatase [Secundilactobacillus kimchicus JCM 15530]MBT9672410.1 protein-tyrosine-phosphatase [Secundilactobacillus kimchicus]